ncbi:hypothetical protein HHK36_004843 [Tetracentron sinense]|uniref:WPP domain-associated protein n=1 Tax=Tetracentron sinense TaxID=13715 RepID=A0A834ZK81_TETSI|nr:hypothetical protein HHK36_004843 [Tetracentron sinense]
MCIEPRRTKFRLRSSFSDTVVEQDSMKDSLDNLRIKAEDQFKRLNKEIDGIKGCGSIRKISSGSELLGLGGILEEHVPQKWVEVDKTLETLKTTLNTVYECVDDVVNLCDASLCESQQERRFKEQLEAMVIRNFLRSLHEEFEAKLWEQRAQVCGSQSINWLPKINELSSLRQELDAISRSLSIPEMGQLPSHLSHEGGEEWNTAIRKDRLQRNVLSSHMSLPTSLREGIGKLEESKNTMLKTTESSKIEHMTKDELVNYFKNEMSEMKRNHESIVHDLTEECFILKREFLKEKGPSSSLRKDKEFDILRKKIPDFILKLDDILMENEKSPACCKDSESLSRLKGRLDTLLSVNRHLKDLLTDKGKEVDCRLSNHSFAELNLLKQIRRLKSGIEDANTEISVREEVYKCVIREVAFEIKQDIEDIYMESIIKQEICGIIFKEAVRDVQATINWGIEDSELESIIIQEMRGIIFAEVIKDNEAKLNLMEMKYKNENEMRVSLEANALDKENALRIDIGEKEQLKQEIEIIFLSSSLEECEKLAREALTKEKEHFELVIQDLNKLKDHARQQEILISESNIELDSRKDELVAALEKIDVNEVEIRKLNQKLKLATMELRKADEEKKKLHGVIQEKENNILSIKAEENEHRKKMESIIMSVQGLSKRVVDFECRVAKEIERNNLRFENLNVQCNPLIQKANLLRSTGLVYKQRLEIKCSDLQKAEAEVDLLGDEVDALSSLLEKIYIALDHYSPILQHYPGTEDDLKAFKDIFDVSHHIYTPHKTE